MDVEKKISCSLDDLIKMQRRKPLSTNVGSAPKRSRAAPGRLDSRPARQRKAPAAWKARRDLQSTIQRQEAPEQHSALGKKMHRKQKSAQRQQKQKGLHQQQLSQSNRQQKRQTGINQYLSAPLDTYISSKQVTKQRRGQLGKNQAIFSTPRQLGRRQTNRNATAALESGGRGVASKGQLRPSLRPANVSAQTIRKVAVRTRRPPIFKSAERRSKVLPKVTTASATGSSKRTKGLLTNRRIGSGRVQLRQGRARQGLRVNMSLGRYRGSGGVSRFRSRRGIPVSSRSLRAPSAPVLTAAASNYGVGSTVKQPQVVYRGPPRSSHRSGEALSSTGSTARHDEELFSKIKIMTSLESVPPPLQQQRGAPVAIPSAMRDLDQAPPPIETVTESQKIGTLSSRFAY